MWHLSLHKPWTSRRVVRITPRSRSRSLSLDDRHYLIMSLPIPFARMALFEVDVWRPLSLREREYRRNRPMDGEIRPMSDEERARHMGHQ